MSVRCRLTRAPEVSTWRQVEKRIGSVTNWTHHDTIATHACLAAEEARFTRQTLGTIAANHINLPDCMLWEGLVECVTALSQDHDHVAS